MTTTRLQIRIQAPPSAVFHALLDAEAVATWMVPDGMTSHVHEFDATEGGRFRISLTYDAPTTTGKTSPQIDTFHGRFAMIVPEALLVQKIEFESADPSMRGVMTATYTLVDTDGETDLIATHENLPPGVSPEDNETGWRMSLGKLKRLVESRQG